MTSLESEQSDRLVCCVQMVVTVRRIDLWVPLALAVRVLVIVFSILYETDLAVMLVQRTPLVLLIFSPSSAPQYVTADAEMIDPSVENPEFKGSPFYVWSRSGYCLACFTCCQGFLPSTNFYLPRPFTFICFQNLSRVFSVVAVASAGSCVTGRIN